MGAPDHMTSPDSIVWYDYDDGMKLLVGSAKFGIIYFDTTDCGPCFWMQDSVWSDPRIIRKVKEDFIAIKVQTARNAAVHYQGREFTESYLRKLFMLPGYPTTLFLEGRRNKMVGGQPSIIKPETMIDYMEYMTSKAYLSTEFEQYVEDKKFMRDSED